MKNKMDGTKTTVMAKAFRCRSCGHVGHDEYATMCTACGFMTMHDRQGGYWYEIVTGKWVYREERKWKFFGPKVYTYLLFIPSIAQEACDKDKRKAVQDGKEV